VTRRDETFSVHVNFGQYYLADPDSYPGMGGPDPEEFPDFSAPDPLRRLQSAPGLVFVAASDTHTGTLPVRYVLSDDRPETSAEYPEVVGEVTAHFPTGRAELRGLMDAAASDISLLENRPGTYVVRLQSRGDGTAAGEAHLLTVWPADSQ